MATVLVADDEAAVREFVRRVLAGRGHRVLVAADAAEALRLAGGEPVHLLVSDVMMPGGGGTWGLSPAGLPHKQTPPSATDLPFRVGLSGSCRVSGLGQVDVGVLPIKR